MYFGERILNVKVFMFVVFFIFGIFIIDVLYNMKILVKNNLILRRFKYFYFEM